MRKKGGQSQIKKLQLPKGTWLLLCLLIFSAWQARAEKPEKAAPAKTEAAAAVASTAEPQDKAEQGGKAAAGASATTAASAATPALSAVAKAAQLVREDGLESLRQQRPELDIAQLLAFYADYAPDLLAEWERRCAQHPSSADAYLSLLAEHYASVVKSKDEDPEEYERLLWQQRLESDVRQLSRRIQDLSRPDADDSLADTAARQLSLQGEKLRLRQLMEESFDRAQQRQLVEINRLENDVRDLRRLLSERAANRQLILEQRFKILTGEDWPQSPADEREHARPAVPMEQGAP
jgi:hypothetical protein